MNLQEFGVLNQLKIKDKEYTVVFIKKAGSTHIYRAGPYAVLHRNLNLFPKYNPSLEGLRRVSATKIVWKYLEDLVRETEFIYPTSDQICRVVIWLDNVVEIRKIGFDRIFFNPLISISIVRLNLFVIRMILFKGMMFDLFTTFGDIKMHFGIASLISNNIFIGNLPDNEKEIVFVDPDWYFKVSDSNLTGFPKLAYIKRILQGLVTTSISMVVFSLIFVIASTYRKSKLLLDN